jgi:hypothetical protein
VTKRGSVPFNAPSEPGSTIKPIVVALALDGRKAEPQTLINTAPGTYRIGPNVIHDTSNHEPITRRTRSAAASKPAALLRADRPHADPRASFHMNRQFLIALLITSRFLQTAARSGCDRQPSGIIVGCGRCHPVTIGSQLTA